MTTFERDYREQMRQLAALMAKLPTIQKMKADTSPPSQIEAADDGPLTVSYPVHMIAHNLLRVHTGQEGGCPKIDWYKLRGEISDAIAVALDKQRKRDILLQEPGRDECDHRRKGLAYMSWGACCKGCGEPYPFDDKQKKDTSNLSEGISALTAIIAERNCQIAKGYDAAHDDKHIAGDIINSSWGATARIYAAQEHGMSGDINGYKQYLIQAAAQIIAEVERVDRATAQRTDAPASGTHGEMPKRREA